MASAAPNTALKKVLQYLIDQGDVRARLCMNTTTCDTEIDAIANLSSYTLIDVCDATGYADITLAGEATTADDANNRGEYDADDLSFTGLSGDATRDAQGVLLFFYVDGTNANDLPLCFIDFTADIPSTATQVDVPWNVEAILQLATA